MPPKQDLRGLKFNKVTILDYAPEYPIKHNLKSKGIFYKCLCDCGNIFYTRGTLIKSGQIKSCGCSRKENTTKINLLGKKFGYLTVLEEDPKRTNAGAVKWICQCECGNIKSISGNSLITGNTKSCGCKQYANSNTNSIGE